MARDRERERKRKNGELRASASLEAQTQRGRKDRKEIKTHDTEATSTQLLSKLERARSNHLTSSDLLPSSVPHASSSRTSSPSMNDKPIRLSSRCCSPRSLTRCRPSHHHPIRSRLSIGRRRPSSRSVESIPQGSRSPDLLRFAGLGSSFDGRRSDRSSWDGSC